MHNLKNNHPHRYTLSGKYRILPFIYFFSRAPESITTLNGKNDYATWANLSTYTNIHPNIQHIHSLASLLFTQRSMLVYSVSRSLHFSYFEKRYLFIYFDMSKWIKANERTNEKKNHFYSPNISAHIQPKDVVACRKHSVVGGGGAVGFDSNGNFILWQQNSSTTSNTECTGKKTKKWCGMSSSQCGWPKWVNLMEGGGKSLGCFCL